MYMIIKARFPTCYWLITGLLAATLFSTVSSAAVILQYHHVSDKTPRSTSLSIEEFTAHLDWLEKNRFTIIALPELISRIENNQLKDDESIASISFDDTGKSVCTNAAPLLVDRQWPFSVFINTAAMTRSSKSQCSWDDLRAIQKTGLLSIGNHSHNHLHMSSQNLKGDLSVWQDKMREEIILAETIIRKKLDVQVTMFAYPYGEFDQRLQAIVEELGYTAVGQQSGPIGNNSQLLALPRFPLSGAYANIDNLKDKLLSIPFPFKKETLTFNPDRGKTIDNAPLLTLLLARPILSRAQCFLGNGTPIVTTQTPEQISARSQFNLTSGRNRYNCTATSPLSGRFYWYSRQWLQY
jgi:peptidoglycan/xylan/chitin deacetylase (PgdA/CDA1 family)